MQFFDRFSLGQPAEIAGARTMRNGAMIVQARAARSGNVQTYAGAEVERPDLPIVRVYRDADEIFRADSLRTFGHKPVTVDHPAGPVTSQTWRQVARGVVGGEVIRDGEFVKIPMMLADAEAINAAKTTHGEVSVGYTCDLDWTPGTAPDGQPYDARQVKVIVDHVAIVPKGRAGPECRLGDEHPSDHGSMKVLPTADRGIPSMHKLTVDGVTIELSDTAREVVSKLLTVNSNLVRDNDRLTGELTAAGEATAQVVQAKDGEITAIRAEHSTAIQAKDGEIAALRAQIPDAAALDARATARAALIGDAQRVLGSGFDASGKADAEIRRAVVSHVLGDAAKDMTDAEVSGAYKVAAKAPAGADPIRQTIASGLRANDGATVINDAHAAMVDRLRNGWMTPTQQGAH